MNLKIFRKILVASIFNLAFLSTPISAHAAAAAFTLHGAGTNYTVTPEQLTEWRTPPPAGNTYTSFQPEQNLNNFVLVELGLSNQVGSRLNFDKYNLSSIYGYVKNLETGLNGDAQEAKMVIQDGRVTDFNPGQTGKVLDSKLSIDAIIAALDQNKTEADLTISETQPLNNLSQTNNLGINELVAYGESNFAGSPHNRIFNIKVGVQKEAGTILKPGEEFSFNKYLGPVDGEHGFLPELVIKKEGTVPEFGGGLCQVSSTVFRAAMNAGLPITARRNHSYAVSYYAPQGTDATIYPGVQDIKFVNDTGASLLVWPVISDNNKLRFYLYGTKDSRKVTFDGPHTFDHQSNGALKAIWTRFITTDSGEQKKDVFNSNYQSPALFHKTTTFPSKVSSNPNAPLPPPTPSPTTPPATSAPTTTPTTP
jgi:vancomycin resistance protein YoaR